ncbi:hypothetical protein CsSME_00052783 [Camellia sinensis var. sinensis]
MDGGFRFISSDEDVYEMMKFIVGGVLELYIEELVLVPLSFDEYFQDVNVEEWDWECNTTEMSIYEPNVDRYEHSSNFASEAEYEVFVDSDYSLNEEPVAGVDQHANGFASLEESEDGDDGLPRTKYKEFKSVSGKKNPIFELGMIFKSRAQFAIVVRHHAIFNGKDIRFKKNEGVVLEQIVEKDALGLFLHL